MDIMKHNLLRGGRDMDFNEASPLPEACRDCTEPECDVCEHGMERCLLSPEEERRLKEKLRQQGGKHFLSHDH